MSIQAEQACVVCYTRSPDFICLRCLDLTFDIMRGAFLSTYKKPPSNEDIKRLCEEGNTVYFRQYNKKTNKTVIRIADKKSYDPFSVDLDTYTVTCPNTFNTEYYDLLIKNEKL